MAEELQSAAKAGMRDAMRRRLAELTDEERAAAAEKAAGKILSLPAVAEIVSGGSGTVAVYFATRGEICMDRAIDALLDAGAKVAAPRWNGAAYSLARVERGCPLRDGPMGIREPAQGGEVPPGEVRVWLVPGLAFSRDGARLGHGGGWYDRLLSRASEGALAVGVAYSFQVLDSIPCEDHDIAVSAVVDER